MQTLSPKISTRVDDNRYTTNAFLLDTFDCKEQVLERISVY